MVWGNISPDLQPRDIVVLVISREILSQCNLIIQIIKNNQINKINQDRFRSCYNSFDDGVMDEDEDNNCLLYTSDAADE